MSVVGVISGADRWTIIAGDCLRVLVDLPQVDHIITDPPYSRHQHESVRRGVGGSATDGNGRMSRAALCRNTDLGFEHLSPRTRRETASHFARLARRWVAVFSDVESCWLWRLSLVAAGLQYVRTCEWRRIGGAPQFTGDRPAQSFETITLAHPKGRNKWNGGGKVGAWDVPIVANRSGHRHDRVHPTQKPIALMRQIIEDFTDPGDLVLDPFAGSGSTGVACMLTGRRFIGIELDDAHAATAFQRMQDTERAAVRQPGLFAETT